MKPIGILACILFLWTITIPATVCSSITKIKGKNIVNTTSKINYRISPDDDDDFVPYQGERFNVFDWILFRTMASKYSGNMLIAPVSVKLALVLLYEGAQDQTAHELATVMQLPVSRSATRDKFSGILESLQMVCPQYTLDIGTQLYVDTGVLTRQRYSAIVKAFYEVDLINTNLSDTQYVTEKINGWVKNITRGNIDKMIEDENDIKDSVMLVMNAIFFKASWRKHFFSPNDTSIGKFHIGPNKSVNVSYMNTINRFYYSESSELDSKILRLPYDGHKFAMYVILPNSLNGINHLVTAINPFILSRHMWLMQELPIEVSLPKFKFDFSSHLQPSLREMGIRDIFDNTATLTGIAKTRRSSRHLRVSEIIQKAGIEVNENGTTAYAATGIQIGNKISDQTFHANHPFVFYIEDESSGTVLYAGKVTNPLQQEGSTDENKQELLTRLNENIPTIVPTSGKLRFDNLRMTQRH